MAAVFSRAKELDELCTYLLFLVLNGASNKDDNAHLMVLSLAMFECQLSKANNYCHGNQTFELCIILLQNFLNYQ